MEMLFGPYFYFLNILNIVPFAYKQANISTILLLFQVVLGLHIVRGDNIAIIGEIDEEIDKRLDLKNVRAEPITSIVH